MFDVGGGELLLIVVAILVLFGPKKIPEIASMIGQGMRKVRQAQDEFTQHMRDLSTDLERDSPMPSPASIAPVVHNINALPEAEILSSEAETPTEAAPKDDSSSSSMDQSTPLDASAPFKDLNPRDQQSDNDQPVQQVRIQAAPGNVSR